MGSCAAGENEEEKKIERVEGAAQAWHLCAEALAILSLGMAHSDEQNCLHRCRITLLLAQLLRHLRVAAAQANRVGIARAKTQTIFLSAHRLLLALRYGAKRAQEAFWCAAYKRLRYAGNHVLWRLKQPERMAQGI